MGQEVVPVLGTLESQSVPSNGSSNHFNGHSGHLPAVFEEEDGVKVEQVLPVCFIPLVVDDWSSKCMGRAEHALEGSLIPT